MGKWGFRIANGIVHIGFWISCLLLIVFWGKIPQTIATHFNSSGTADAWGSKGSLLLMVFMMVYMYFMHLICMRVIRHLSTKEKMYGKKLAAFVTDEDFEAENLTTMAYLAWVDASLLLMFDYIIVCSAASRPLGGWFIWAVLIAMLGELVLYFVCHFRRKRQIRMRMLLSLAAHGDEPGKTWDDM